MIIQLDHLLVPSRDKNGAAKLLAEVLGVRWEPCGEKPMRPQAQPPDIDWPHYRAQRASVYVSDSLTIDCIDPWLYEADNRRVNLHHYCFRVSDTAFDEILKRVKHIGLKYWSDQQFGEPDFKINNRLGGKGFYFTEPDGHSWEILTVSYARPPK